MDTAAVLTGVDTEESILSAPAGDRPTYLLADLTGLHRPYPAIDGRDGVGPSDAAGGAFGDADGFDFAIPDINVSVWGAASTSPG